MPGKRFGPLLSLALSSLMIGSLYHLNWILVSTGVLFGFGFAIAVQRPPRYLLWLAVLAAGAPVAGLAAHLIPGIRPPSSLFIDVAGGLFASTASIGPGYVTGWIFRRFRSRRAQPSAIA